MIFFHRDQDGRRSTRVDAEWLDPLRLKWGKRPEILVPVVPIRMTEAWMLADGDALRAALGVRWTNRELGVPPNPGDVEKLTNPKHILSRIGARLTRHSIASYFDRLGEEVSIDLLRQVPAFRNWWSETVAALEMLGYRPRG